MNHRPSTDESVLGHLVRKSRPTPGCRAEKFVRPVARRLIVGAIFPLSIFLLTLLSSPGNLHAQGLELSGGYVHSTGDFGLDGFQTSGAWFFTQKVAVAGTYDSVWDTSRVGTFDLTTVGAISAKNHLQNFMFGPRFYLRTRRVDKYPIIPFGEAQFGLSHLNSTIQEGFSVPLSAADTAFTWLLGAGADYSLSPHWSARVQLGLLRTHLNDQGQSRLRVGIGINYTFGERR